MRAPKVRPTGVERTFRDDEVIVSKTDLQGRITYVNDVFLGVSRYAEEDVIGQPHNLIRHPDMPRSAFKLLWDTIASGDEIFAYVLNLASDGAHYWVLAHVTPTFGLDGRIVGYHSNRRVPARAALEKITPVYAQMLAAERAAGGTQAALEAGGKVLRDALNSLSLSYEEFIWTLDATEALV